MWASRFRLLVADRLAEPVAAPLGASIAAAALLAISAAIVGALLARTTRQVPMQPLPRVVSVTVPVVATTPEPTRLIVHLEGAVRRPGVYEVDIDQRTTDLVDLAGGTTPDADLARINLAAPLIDGQRLYVPAIGEEALPLVHNPAPTSVGEPRLRPVDINTASAAELQRLIGIGPALAAEIVAHRDTWGAFASVDDLLDVRGIGPAKLSGFRESVNVN